MQRKIIIEAENSEVLSDIFDLIEEFLETADLSGISDKYNAFDSINESDFDNYRLKIKI